MTVARIVLWVVAIDLACLLTLTALLLVTERGHAADQPATVCVSAIGPVDAEGNGDTTPDLDCYPIGANP